MEKTQAVLHIFLYSVNNFHRNNVEERKVENRKQKGKDFLKRHIKLWAFLFLLATAWIISAGMDKARAAMLQKGISQEVLRFHVLANSDSGKDQQVKLAVRDEILAWLETELTEEEQNNLELMEEQVEELLTEIEKRVEDILKEQGFGYGARVKLEMVTFPERIYGDCIFPAGKYKALRILLGEAEGQNWWCVLFPRLCFLDCVHAVLPEQSQEQLQNVLTEEEYESLFDPAEDEYKICFKYF